MKLTKKLIALCAVLLLAVTLTVTLAIVGGASDTIPTLTLKSAGLNLESKIEMFFRIDAKNTGDVDLLVWTAPQSEYTISNKEKVIAEPRYTDDNGYLTFFFDEYAAKQMPELVYIRAYTRVDGVDYYSEVQKYSILQYCYNKLNATDEASVKLQPLIEAILDYGAEAQSYFGKNPTRLANGSWQQIKLVGGVFDDGFAKGLYLPGDTLTITAPATDANGMVFSHWETSAGKRVSINPVYTITVGSAPETYTAVYSSDLGIDGYTIAYSANVSNSIKLCASELYAAVSKISTGVTLSEGTIPDSKCIHICDANEFKVISGTDLPINDYYIYKTSNGVAIGAGGTEALEEAIKFFTENLVNRKYIDGFDSKRVRFRTGTTKIEEILSAYNDPYGRLMSMGHRADLLNHPENSLEAIQSCIEAGVDIIELDIQRTKDGKYVLMHDDTVDRTTNGTGKVSEMTLAEIQALFLKEGDGGANAALTNIHPPSFEQALAKCKNKIMINLDKDANNFESTDTDSSGKTIDYFTEIYTLLANNDCLNIAMFKKSVTATDSNGNNIFDTYVVPKFQALKDAGKPLPLFSASFGATNAKASIDKVAGFTKMVEFANTKILPSELKEITDYAREKGMRMMVLSIWENDDSADWEQGVEAGYSCFMTNHALDLVQYINSTTYDRASTEVIRASDFTDQLGVVLSPLSSYDAKVHGRSLTELSTGDFVRLPNIVFSGNETSVNLVAKPYSALTVKLYVDSVASENLIGTVTLPAGHSDEFEFYKAALSKSVSGKHDVILAFEGSGCPYTMVDLLTFREGDNTPIALVNPYVKCIIGNVSLPATVEILNENGKPIDVAVTWSPAASYAVGTHTVSGTTSYGNVSLTLEVVDGAYIKTAADWNSFANAVNGGDSYEGKFVALGANINFASTSFVSAGQTNTTPFKGTFDGNGYTISNISYSTSTYGYAGLFGYAQHANIRNVNLSNCSFTSSGVASDNMNYAGSVLAKGLGVLIEHCSVAGGTLNTTPQKSGGRGGLAGYIVNDGGIESYIINCNVTNTTITAYRDTGGFIGDLYSGNILNCSVTGTTITTEQNSNGGFAGDVHGGTLTNCYASTTVNYISGKNHIGIFAGYFNGNPTFTNCTYDATKANGLPVVCEECYGKRTYNGVILPAASVSSYTMVTDFDNNVKSIAGTDNNKGKVEFVDSSESGKALHVYGSEAVNQVESGVITLTGIDVTGYKGLIYYVDFRNTEAGYYINGTAYYQHALPLVLSTSANTGGTESTMRSYGAGSNAYAYYYADGVWKLTAPHSSTEYRMMLPEGFCGYVYLPFECFQIASGAGTTGTDWGTTVSGGQKYLIKFYSFCSKIDGTGDMLLDNFYLVK